VLIVLVAQLMLVLDATVVNVALPGIDGDLGFGPASLSWVLNAYTLAFGGLLCSAAASATSAAGSGSSRPAWPCWRGPNAGSRTR
jgi:MFS family permease